MRFLQKTRVAIRMQWPTAILIFCPDLFHAKHVAIDFSANRRTENMKSLATMNTLGQQERALMCRALNITALHTAFLPRRLNRSFGKRLSSYSRAKGLPERCWTR